MNHKRGRARNRRAGCKMCKPWKVNGHRTERPDGERFSDHKRRVLAARDVDLGEPVVVRGALAAGWCLEAPPGVEPG